MLSMRDFEFESSETSALDLLNNDNRQKIMSNIEWEVRNLSSSDSDSNRLTSSYLIDHIKEFV